MTATAFGASTAANLPDIRIPVISDALRIGPGSTSAGMFAAAPKKLTPPRVQ